MRLFKVLFQACLIFTILALVIPNVWASQFTDKPGQTVKIGLLIPDNKSLAAKHGAEMAIRITNEKGGFNGRPFQLVVRSMEVSLMEGLFLKKTIKELHHFGKSSFSKEPFNIKIKF